MEKTVTGVLGSPWRADITAWGGIEPWDGSPHLDWWISAEDRWHDPRVETAVRQARRAGTPVVETRVRVPGGDVVHTAYSTADNGGLTVVELHNDSPAAVAVALSRPDLLTDRPTSGVLVEGIDVPSGTVVMPLGHRTTVKVALAHRVGAVGPLPAIASTAESVARGWLVTAERAGRLVLPDDELVERVVAERCRLALVGPEEEDDEVTFLLALTELVRLGEPPDSVAVDIVAACERIIGAARRCGLDWNAHQALVRAGVTLDRAGERRAVRDLADARHRLGGGAPRPDVDPGGAATIAWVESCLASPIGDGCRVLPLGVPASWMGSNFEGHGLPAGLRTTLSYALRWHGDRPAILWEQRGPAQHLTSGVDPTWSSDESAGEALWEPPAPDRSSS